MNHSSQRPMLSRLSLLIALLSLGGARTVFADSPFAPLPLAIQQNKVEVHSNAIDLDNPKQRPNLYFIFDDSQSMADTLPDHNRRREDWKTWNTITIGAIEHLVQDPKYRDRINLYLMDLCGMRPAPQVDHPLTTAEFIGNTGGEHDFEGSGLKGLGQRMDCGDISNHSAEAYYEALYFARKNINEAKNTVSKCQKNIVLYLGAGRTNTTKIFWDHDGVARAAGSSILDLNPGYDTSVRTRSIWERSVKWFAARPENSKWDCPTRDAYNEGRRITGSDRWRPVLNSNAIFILRQYLPGEFDCRFEDEPDWSIYSQYTPNVKFYGDPSTDSVHEDDGYAAPYLRRGRSFIDYVSEKQLRGPAEFVGTHDMRVSTKVNGAYKPCTEGDVFCKNIKTYAIGVNAQTGHYLDGAAYSLPLRPDGHRAYLAQNAQDFEEDFRKILDEVVKISDLGMPSSYSYTSPATLGDRKLDNGVGVHILTGLIRGQLRFFKYDLATGKFGNDFSGVPSFYQEQAPASVPNKAILTHRGDRFFFLNDAQNLSNSDFGLVENDNKAWSKYLVPWLVISGATPERNDTAINQRFAQAGGKAQRFRVRADKIRTGSATSDLTGYFMGDVVDSPVMPGGVDVEAYETSMQQFLLTSSNDGMSYIFERTPNATAAHPYDLRLRYLPLDIPREGTDTIGKQLGIISQPNYGQAGSPHPHEWLNNGGITVRTMLSAPENGNAQVVMAATPGQGGRGVYALNVGGKDFFTGSPTGVDGDAWLREVPLFSTTAYPREGTLGYIMGNPPIARIAPCRTAKGEPSGVVPDLNSGSVTCAGAGSAGNVDTGVLYTVFYGSGYNAPQNDPAVYVRLLLPHDYGAKAKGVATIGRAGMLIRKIALPGAEGVSTPTVVDRDFDGIADLVYVGTQNGKLYRIDLRKPTPDQWTAVQIFETQTVPFQHYAHAGNAITNKTRPVTEGVKIQPISSAPDVFRQAPQTVNGKSVIRYNISFGTGSGLYDDDIYDLSQQSVYSVEDRPDEEGTKVLTIHDLERRTLSDTAGQVRKVSDEALPKDKRGWYADLNSSTKQGLPSGERVLNTPIVVKTSVIFSSTIYDPIGSEKGRSSDEDSCSVSISSGTHPDGWVMIFDAQTGKAPGVHQVGIKGLEPGGKPTNGTNGSKEVGKYVKNITNLTLFRGSGNNLGKGQSSLTDSGSEWSGTAEPLKHVTLPNNQCMTEEEAQTMKLVGQNALGVNNDIKLRPAICTQPGSLYRVNYRRITL